MLELPYRCKPCIMLHVTVRYDILSLVTLQSLPLCQYVHSKHFEHFNIYFLYDLVVLLPSFLERLDKLK